MRLYAKIRPSTILLGVNVWGVNIEQFLPRSNVLPFITINDVVCFIYRYIKFHYFNRLAIHVEQLTFGLITLHLVAIFELELGGWQYAR